MEMSINNSVLNLCFKFILCSGPGFDSQYEAHLSEEDIPRC